ncbi:hypothetical protein ACKUT0_00040, partial [Klebsiella oxytoca]
MSRSQLFKVMLLQTLNLTNRKKNLAESRRSEKNEDAYTRIVKQQEEQIALAGQSNELAKIKYQIVQ